jgi:hypothetical protein
MTSGWFWLALSLSDNDERQFDAAHVIGELTARGSHAARHVTKAIAVEPAPPLLDQSKKAGGEVGGLHRPYPADGGGRISIER